MSSDPPALAVVQARISSTRLPGKSMADIQGEPMLSLLLKRLARARGVREAIVATSTHPSDEPIVEFARAHGVKAVRGPLEDVLTRFAIAISGHQGPVVRITGDCPLVDPAVVDDVLDLFLGLPGCAYASNLEPRSFPDGLDVEVFDAAALTALANEPLSAPDREHVTSALRERPQRFRKASLVSELDLGELRWTVDTPPDLEFIRKLVTRLGDRRHKAGLVEILQAVRAPPSLAAFHGRRG